MGKVIIISGPFGSGKNTIIEYILKTNPGKITKIVTATTRKPRENEHDKIDKHFMSLADFKLLESQKGFIETNEVNEGVWYGTPFFALEDVINSDKWGIMDIDVEGAMQIKEKLGDKVLLVFVKTEDIAEQEKRLRERGTETEEMIQERLSRRNYELSFEDRYDVSIVNGELDKTMKTVDNFVKSLFHPEHERTYYQEFRKGLS